MSPPLTNRNYASEGAAAGARTLEMRPTPVPANAPQARRSAGGRIPPKIKVRGPKFLAEAYGLADNPFGVTPDTRYLYESKTHAEAKASLLVGIECSVGFQALIAPPGMGKTTMLFSILEQFDKAARTAFLFQTQGTPRDFLRYLIHELGGTAEDTDWMNLQDTINQLLLRERRAGRRTIVIVDEAQALSAPVLETLRLLSNFETSTEKLLHIILAGQPQLAQTLANPDAAQLSQRICMVTTLAPFSLVDTARYIEHRLRVAGYEGPPLFAPAVIAAIWKRSGGIPREINKLCFNSLLLARAMMQRQVNSSILREVTNDLDLNRARPQGPARISQILGNQGSIGSNDALEQLAASIDRLCEGGFASSAPPSRRRRKA
ncbi:MAG TPA: AAA family ATPase [Terriglobales bacterium]|nr:AAA family ATPase [Terriglobales bacterium]